jgi:uncharacterized protein (DUF58 family)
MQSARQSTVRPNWQARVPRLGKNRQEPGARVVRALRRHPVLYAVLALMVVAFVSGAATGFDLMVKLNYVLLMILVVSYAWSRIGAAQISASVKRPKGPFSVGDRMEEEIEVRNNGRAPKAFIEIEDKTDVPGLVIRQVTSLGIMVGFNRLRASGQLTRRGEFTIGPLVVRASDPFALFPREIEFKGAEKILVYPRIVPVPDFAAPAVHQAGDNSRQLRANILSTDVSSVRDYAAGDAVSRIHWPSTARTQRLMVKQFDRGAASHVWIVLDQHRDSQAGEAPDSVDEYGATIAASVVDRYARSFLPVGYAAHGTRSLVAAPDRSSAHREAIMRHIAASRGEGDVPMLDILSELEREFSQSSSLVVVSGASDGDWTRALAGLQRRGVRVTAVMFDRASFGGQANDDAVQSLLMGGITTYRIRKGDATADALSAPVGGSARNARPDLAAMKRVRPHTPAPAEAPA